MFCTFSTFFLFRLQLFMQQWKYIIPSFFSLRRNAPIHDGSFFAAPNIKTTWTHNVWRASPPVSQIFIGFMFQLLLGHCFCSSEAWETVRTFLRSCTCRISNSTAFGLANRESTEGLCRFTMKGNFWGHRVSGQIEGRQDLSGFLYQIAMLD